MIQMINIKNVYSGGQPGTFRANEEMIGWKGESGGKALVHSVENVKRAEWLEGKLRVLCADEDSNETVLALEGFNASDFDVLWRHFEEYSGVYIRKHRPASSLSEASFDTAMQSLERSADKVDEAAAGSVLKKAKEQDLLKKVEGVRDGLEEAVKGDKQALSRVFAANGCERIGRLRLVLDTVQLEVYKRDQRWQHIRNIARTVESVLREIGTFRLWKPSEEDTQDASMKRRQMVWELRKRQGGGDLEEEGMLREEWETGEAIVEEQSVKESKSKAVSNLRERLEGQGFNPLGGFNPLAGPPSGYGGNQEVSEPQAPEPELAGDDSDEEEAVWTDEAGEEDLRQYEDQQVTDPVNTPAAPPGHENDMHHRMSYTRKDSVLEGWVWKRSRFLRTWRRRWLVLSPSCLETFKIRGGQRPTEVIEEGSVHRVYSADGEVSMARCFCVVGARRTLYMVCDQEAEKAEWISKISSTLGNRR